MQDYEFAGLQRRISFGVARRVLVPDSIPVERMRKIGAKERKLVRYPGLKEEYYLAGFEPDPAVLDELGLDREKVAGRRPPAARDLRVPRAQRPLRRDDPAPGGGARGADGGDPAHRVARARRCGRWAPQRLIVPERAIDAQSLIAFADLVVSAGGTMNREAVALGTPVFTTFAGRMGGVDEALIAEGRLRVLEDPAALELRKRRGPGRRAATRATRRSWSTVSSAPPGASNSLIRPTFPSGTRYGPDDNRRRPRLPRSSRDRLAAGSLRRAPRLPDRRDRPAEGARAARPADAAPLRAWRSSPGSRSPAGSGCRPTARPARS